MSKFAYIYTLADPRTDFVRYVGKTFDLKQRNWQHLHDVKRGLNTRKTGWIKSLLKSGFWPKMEVLETFPADAVEQWEEAERFWISALRSYGCQLTNLDSGGGSGRTHSLESKIKIGQKSSLKRHSSDTKARISAASKARMTPEEKERLRIKCSKNRHTEETKKIIAASKIGKPRPEHVRLALLNGSIKWKLEHGFNMNKPDGKFAQELKTWRSERGLYQKQAASALGVGLGTYGSWEYALREPTEMSKPEIRRRMAATPMPPTPTVIVKRLPMGC